MTDAYTCLDSLRTMLRVRRQSLMEQMASGFTEADRYREFSGRCRELVETIDKISTQIKSLYGDSDDQPAKK